MALRSGEFGGVGVCEAVADWDVRGVWEGVRWGWRLGWKNDGGKVLVVSGDEMKRAGVGRRGNWVVFVCLFLGGITLPLGGC